MSKDFKIFGMSYGLLGDLVMGLPLLTYYEKKYPGSYKFWVIEKKCAISAPLYFNHPLIDRIKITDEWGKLGEGDKEIRAQCDVHTVREGWKHSSKQWYNYKSCVEETAILAGVYDITEVLSKKELRPKLYKWFDEGFFNERCHTYTREHIKDINYFGDNIAIWPFATATGGNRSPSVSWWEEVINKLIFYGYNVYHYGRNTEPDLCTLPRYKRFTHLSYFEQVKAALASRLCIGTDSGSMWVMGAYAHPAVHIMTNWLPGHNKNFMALEPVNERGVSLFEEGGCDNVKPEAVVKQVKEIFLL